jgi:hypothetical protein
MRYGLAALLVATAATGWSLAVTRDGPPRHLLRMHDDFLLAFIDSDGFGPVRLTPMQRSKNTYRTGGAQRMRVERLQLIGIAKHETPVVFSDGFDAPQHSEKGVPGPWRGQGRPLNADERAALRALDAGERLIVRIEDDGLRVTGPIRAGSECLGCHKKQRAGDMLGALVYTLRPLPPDVSPTK